MWVMLSETGGPGESGEISELGQYSEPDKPAILRKYANHKLTTYEELANFLNEEKLDKNNYPHNPNEGRVNLSLTLDNTTIIKDHNAKFYNTFMKFSDLKKLEGNYRPLNSFHRGECLFSSVVVSDKLINDIGSFND